MCACAGARAIDRQWCGCLLRGRLRLKGPFDGNNDLLHSAKAIYLDVSPYQPDTTNRFLGNRIAFNGVGVVFHNDWEGNVFRDNEFHGNFTQVAVRGGGSAARNTWEGNRWDDYQGFDRDTDGRGDTAYELYSYADRIWQERPEAAFFRGSPLFEAIDFLDRLAPFSAPTLVVRDASPRFDPSESAPTFAEIHLALNNGTGKGGMYQCDSGDSNGGAIRFLRTDKPKTRTPMQRRWQSLFPGRQAGVSPAS